ncbi:hypothetical protein ACFL1B_03310 [Nanoarchaeota archaeon]
MHDHSAFKQWAFIVLGSLLFSSALVITNPGATGFSVYDTGPSPDLNPDLIGEEEWYSNLTTGLMIVAVLIIAQIAVYVTVSRYYKKVDE